MTPNPVLHQDSIVVLHVDDDPQMRNLVSYSLERVNGPFTVRTAADAETALEELDEEIECVVSDYEMPGMNGLELLHEVRDERPDLPFVLLTGKGSEDVASEAVTAGLTDYFQKSDIARQFPVLAQRIETAVEGERAEVSYRELFEKAADGLALNDPESGAFVDANPAFRDILGLDQEELLAMGIGDIRRVPPPAEQETTLVDYLQRAAIEVTTRTEQCCRRPDGERFWMELQFKPIEVKGRSLVLTQAREITERKRYERTLSALHTAVTDIVGAEQSRQVTGSVLSAVNDLLAADRAAVFRHASTENWLEVVDATSLTSISDEVPLTPERPLARAFIDGTLIEAEGESVFEYDSPDTDRYTLLVPIGSVGVLAVGYDDVASFESDDREFAEILTNAAAAAFERIEKEREIHSSHEQLREQTTELRRLERVNATLRELNDTLLRAETRDEVFEAVCDQLGRIEDVKLAWVGTPADGDTLERRAWAGDIPQYLDVASLELESSEEPAVVAARIGSPVHVANTATDLNRDPWKRTALSYGVESMVAHPIEVDGVTYGVLSVLAGDRAAFGDRFGDLLSAVASSVGETVHSIEQRQGLQAAGTVELTFEIRADDHLLKRLAADAGCELEVTGVIAEAGDTCRVFLTVHEGSPTRVQAAADTMSAVRSATVAAENSEEEAVELHLEVPLLGVQLNEYAVRITRLLASADAVRATLKVARPDDIRDVAAAIRERYPGASLLTKHSRTEERSDYDRLLAFRDSLTPRQREVVHMAYLNGYFESPRRCTGEELGEKLGISAQAVYQHIRAAERCLFDEAFRQILTVSTPDDTSE
jgi:PAS domain S-box-containing protein